MNRRKIHWRNYGQTILLVLIVILLIHVCRHSNQASIETPLPIRFQGEYSQGGGEWKTLKKNSVLSALDGDLILRGSFNRIIPEGVPFHFYLNHLAISVSVNNEVIMSSNTWNHDVLSFMCGKYWESFVSPGISTEDVIEIRLHNPHRLGNANAYSEFLNSFMSGSIDILETKLVEQSLIYRVVGVVVLILSLIILGVAVAFLAMRVNYGNDLWTLGMISLFAGGYIALDTIDVSFWCRLIVFNTYATQLCIMLILFELTVIIFKSMVSPIIKIIAKGVMIAEGIFIGIVVMLCLTNAILIYDTLPYWIGIQLVFCPVLLVCCVWEYIQQSKQQEMLLSCTLLTFAVLLDSLNTIFMWWPNGFCWKLVFVLLFTLHLIRGIKHIPESYRASIKAEKLEQELRNSRVILATSQIRAHFIFNVLNAISGMCKYDPDKADQTVVRFARYLRSNIDILQNDRLVKFCSAMHQLEDYVAIEQIRFGEKIQFTKDIAVDDFMMPSLILQPIVENSIMHGLLPKSSGGTILLKTRKEENRILIVIQDDGVGFDTNMIDADKAVGISNVRFRLQHIMNGTLKIESQTGRGTTVMISIPWKEW